MPGLGMPSWSRDGTSTDPIQDVVSVGDGQGLRGVAGFYTILSHGRGYTGERPGLRLSPAVILIPAARASKLQSPVTLKLCYERKVTTRPSHGGAVYEDTKLYKTGLNESTISKNHTRIIWLWTGTVVVPSRLHRWSLT